MLVFVVSIFFDILSFCVLSASLIVSSSVLNCFLRSFSLLIGVKSLFASTGVPAYSGVISFLIFQIVFCLSVIVLSRSSAHTSFGFSSVNNFIALSRLESFSSNVVIFSCDFVSQFILPLISLDTRVSSILEISIVAIFCSQLFCVISPLTF